MKPGERLQQYIDALKLENANLDAALTNDASALPMMIRQIQTLEGRGNVDRTQNRERAVPANERRRAYLRGVGAI